MKIRFTSLFVFCFSVGVFACDCAYIPTFCEYIKTPYFLEDNGHLIMRGIVQSHQEDGMTVEVRDVYFGILCSTTLFIQSGNGANCQRITDLFEDGEELIMAPTRVGVNYSLSECAESILRIENGVLKGSIAQDISEWPMNKLDQLGDCGDWVNSANDGGILFGPNPTTGSAFVKFTGNGAGLTEIRLYDIAGKFIRHFSMPIAMENPVEINLSGYPDGVYLLEAYISDQRYAWKVIKL